MAASSTTRQTRSLARDADPSRSRMAPGLGGLLRSKGALRSAWRREPRPQVAPKSKNDGKESFSLKDSETLGNIGVVGVLATAVAVGGALVIFNPYAGQIISQETIKKVEVPTPLPSPKADKTKPAPPVAPQPTPSPSVAVSPESGNEPSTRPSKPATGVKPSGESGKTSLTLPTSPVAPGKTSKVTAKGGGGGGDLTPLVFGLAVVAAAGGFVAYSGQKASENTGSAAAAADPETDSPAPPAAEAGVAGDDSEERVQEAREWISKWRAKNN